jgi:hypothetical protein
VQDVLSSPEFAQAWVDANRFAHAQIVGILEGDRDVTRLVQVQGEAVVLNLVPVLNRALQLIQQKASGLLGRQVRLPAISGDELPGAACKRISTALGRPLPQTCGQIPLFSAEALGDAKAMVQTFDRVTFLLLFLTPVMIIAALASSATRRRTALQIVVAAMVGLAAVGLMATYLESRLTGSAAPDNRAAVSTIVGDVLSGLFTAIWALLAAGLVVLLLLLVTGPYRWARSLRRAVRSAAQRLRTATLAATKAIGTRAIGQGP